jgi:putative oxidoreductase
MRTASLIAQYLAGVIFLVVGLNGFLNFIPLPPPGGIAGSLWVPYTPRITWW